MPLYTKLEGKVSVGCPPPSSSPSGEEWKSFQFQIHEFASLRRTKNHYIASPEFTCNGHQWQLRVYPGGKGEAAEGNVSAYLQHLTWENTTISYSISIIDKFGNSKVGPPSAAKREFGKDKVDWGWQDFISRSDILDRSQNILDSDGTLTIVVSIGEEPVFVPKNPLVNSIKGMFLDETTADVCFQVVHGDEENEERKESNSSEFFHAHRLILKKCAPVLAAICGTNDSGEMATATITGVKPDMFRHLLWYVYGGSVPEEDLKTHAKDIIDAADKYSIVNLKLEAEAAYVKSADITLLDNAIDNLLYADAKNCALLKEAVMDFLAANPDETAEKVSFVNFPGHLVRDIFVAMDKSQKDASGEIMHMHALTNLGVSALRRKLDEMGLDVDGSREAMIESIKSNS